MRPKRLRADKGAASGEENSVSKGVYCLTNLCRVAIPIPGTRSKASHCAICLSRPVSPFTVQLTIEVGYKIYRLYVVLLLLT